jgi:guanosine-3',5'-bis(diphosphate) 3'-pyrophosphohydrolase
MSGSLQRFDASVGWPALRDRYGACLSETTLAELDAAVEFAVEWHGDQTRPAGEPYVEHLLEALAVLVEGVGVDDRDVLCAVVLHDVVEDTPCTLDEVRQRFGGRVALLVDWVTKREPGPGESAEQARAAYLTRLREAPVEAILVKLADRLSNVQRLATHPRVDKRRSYYRETVDSIVPIASTHAWFQNWYSCWEREFQQLLGANGPGAAAGTPAARDGGGDGWRRGGVAGR